MRSTTLPRTSTIGIEELFQSVSVFGVDESKAIMRDATAKIRDIMTSRKPVTSEEDAFELHKACGRLSLFGVHAPRFMSRELRHAFQNGHLDDVSYVSRAEMLQAVQSAEAQLTEILDEYSAAFEPQPHRANALTTLLPLTVCSYGGGALGFGLTYSLTGTLAGVIMAVTFWFLCMVVLYDR